MINVSDPAATIINALEQRVKALEQDRDYWRRQHDLVMEDWKEDLAQWRVQAAQPRADDRCRDALVDLFRFFDPQTGAIAGRSGADFLGDAFAKALLAYKVRG